MSYIEGFILAVPAANKEEFRRHAAESSTLFKEYGATRHVETWGDDVPDGKLNDFRMAVQAEEGENVVFSWFEYPDRATRDAANQRMMEDERMAAMGASMPFDGKRMIFAGFDTIVDQGSGRGGYVDGYVLPVPDDKKDAYRAMAEKAAAVFQDYGAVRVVEAWGDDVPEGKLTDFHRAAHRKEGESVVYSFVEWPSKESRDNAWKQVMGDERMQPSEEEKNIFDGQRMFWGGFVPIVDA